MKRVSMITAAAIVAATVGLAGCGRHGNTDSNTGSGGTAETRAERANTDTAVNSANNALTSSVTGGRDIPSSNSGAAQLAGDRTRQAMSTATSNPSTLLHGGSSNDSSSTASTEPSIRDRLK